MSTGLTTKTVANQFHFGILFNEESEARDYAATMIQISGIDVVSVEWSSRYMQWGVLVEGPWLEGKTEQEIAVDL
ncbi:hypothetical protein LCGC14_0734920 [marine sediment metagenome]|uniref:Uncharacterized protein n=1 Tax=marine sediment metagenome TaxID=412755 RepID=A0A0F9QTG6_9ZZZZ